MKKITRPRLYNIALYYLSKYESTTGKLRDVLNRRILRAKRAEMEIPAETDTWINEIVAEMEGLGYIDNQRYAQNAFERLQGAGKSIRSISYKLKRAGLEDDVLENILETQEQSTSELDLAAALRLVHKKKLGFLRPIEARKDMYQKDLAVLGRNGFNYEVAQKALKGEED